MNKLSRSITKKYIAPFYEHKWLLNIYLIKSNKYEQVDDNQIISIINKYLLSLEQNCISNEFDYFRTGFAFIHYGNRGVDLTFWHFGKWGDTFETYSCSWYCYDRNVEHMELLDSVEPIVCQYEIPTLIEEFKVVKEIFERLNSNMDFRKEYCTYYSRFNNNIN